MPTQPDSLHPTIKFHRIYPAAIPPMRADKSALGLMPTMAYRHCEAMRMASSFGWYAFPAEEVRLCVGCRPSRHVGQLEGLAAGATVIIDDLVLRDAEDPPPERLRILRSVRRLDRVRERGLDDVLDFALRDTLPHHRDERASKVGANDGARAVGHGVHERTSPGVRRV